MFNDFNGKQHLSQSFCALQKVQKNLQEVFDFVISGLPFLKHCYIKRCQSVTKRIKNTH